MKKLRKEKLNFERSTIYELNDSNMKLIKGGLDNTDVPTVTITLSKTCISSNDC